MSGNRSIFEEVDGEKTEALRPEPRPVGSSDDGTRKSVSRWLFGLFVLLVVMILVGGLTRLTDSGLSITEWKPVTGALPPMSAEAWDSEFEKYKSIPEFQLQNAQMSMAEFKTIYWWEWGHRQLGRVIGLVVDGRLWFDRANGRCGLLPIGDPSGVGLSDLGSDHVVYLPARTLGDGSVSSTTAQGERIDDAGECPYGAGVSANLARRVGGRIGCGAWLY